MPYLSKYKASVIAVIVLGAVAALGSRFTIVFIKPLIDRLHLDPGGTPPIDASAPPSALNEFTNNVLEPWLATVSDWGLGPGVSQAITIVALML